MVQYPNKRLYTLKEAACYLGRGLDSMRELVYRGEIPIVQKGERSKQWVDVIDLDSWIDTNKHIEGVMHN